MSRIRYSNQDKIFLSFGTIALILISLIILYPLLFVLFASFSADPDSLTALTFWKTTLSLEGYKAVFEYDSVWNGYLNSFVYLFVGTSINMLLTICAAHPLAQKKLFGRNLLMFVFVFTMYFSGGIIPSYILMRSLSLLNTRWCIILTGGISIYNMIVMRTFFSTQIPDELKEAADIDGCGALRYLVRIVLPLSKSILAVIALFYAVTHWNGYFHAMIYLTKRDLFPLQVVLRELLILNQIDLSMVDDADSFLLLQERANLMTYSLIVVACVPVMLAYPFVQRYFVKGVMIGAIKG